METISFDTGVREYGLPGGVLRFNPSDPQLIDRYLHCGERMSAVCSQLAAGEDITPVQLMVQVDGKLRQVLTWVFGPENDFQSILAGHNLLSLGENGQYLIVNLLSAVEPILSQGAARCIQTATDRAVAAADARRAQQP